MAANTVLNYLPRQSVVHKMTGTTKLAFFLLFTFASMITYNTWVLLGLMAVSFAAFKLSYIKLREVRFMLIFMLVFLRHEQANEQRRLAGSLQPVAGGGAERRPAPVFLQQHSRPHRPAGSEPQG